MRCQNLKTPIICILNQFQKPYKQIVIILNAYTKLENVLSNLIVKKQHVMLDYPFFCVNAYNISILFINVFFNGY